MKYVRTILVDDDYLVLQDLKNLVDWKALGFQIIGTAPNGKTALQITQKTLPDLIITDISMPAMDGFEFIECIQKNYPDIYIIFISSYADFDYAKRAMKHGIRDYLLKNELTEESLTSLLLQVREYLKNRNTTRHRDFRLRLTEYFSSAQEDLLPDELVHHRYLFFFFSFALPLEKLNLHFQHITEYGNELSLLLQEKIHTLYPNSLLFNMDNLLIVGIPAKDLDEPVSVAAISRTCQAILSSTESCSERKILGAFFPERMSLPDCKKSCRSLLPLMQFQNSFPGTFQKNLSLLSRQTYVPVHQVFAYELLQTSQKHPENYYEQLNLFLSTLFEARDADSIFMLYHNLLLQMERFSGHLINFPTCNYFQNQEELFHFLKTSYEELCIFTSKTDLGKYSRPLTQAMEYMKQNYSNSSLTVEQIAEHCSLSPSRLSVLFKKETGQTVGDYLTDLRISEAIHFLENSNYKIYEVAEKAGYKSAQYFSQVFSQRTGHKPLYFRQKKPS